MKVIEIKWILLILFLMGGCGNYNYIPNTHNVPLLKEEGDIHLDFSCSLPEILGWEGQAAFALRINGIRYNDIQYTEILGIDEQDQIQYINRNPFSILIEPGVILRVGDEFLKFQVEAGYSGNISNTDLLQEDFYFSFGFRVSIANFIRAMFSHASDH
jgi:hypothetical protein